MSSDDDDEDDFVICSSRAKPFRSIPFCPKQEVMVIRHNTSSRSIEAEHVSISPENKVKMEPKESVNPRVERKGQIAEPRWNNATELQFGRDASSRRTLDKEACDSTKHSERNNEAKLTESRFGALTESRFEEAQTEVVGERFARRCKEDRTRVRGGLHELAKNSEPGSKAVRAKDRTSVRGEICEFTKDFEPESGTGRAKSEFTKDFEPERETRKAKTKNREVPDRIMYVGLTKKAGEKEPPKKKSNSFIPEPPKHVLRNIKPVRPPPTSQTEPPQPTFSLKASDFSFSSSKSFEQSNLELPGSTSLPSNEEDHSFRPTSLTPSKSFANSLGTSGFFTFSTTLSGSKSELVTSAGASPKRDSVSAPKRDSVSITSFPPSKPEEKKKEGTSIQSSSQARTLPLSLRSQVQTQVERECFFTPDPCPDQWVSLYKASPSKVDLQEAMCDTFHVSPRLVEIAKEIETEQKGIQTEMKQEEKFEKDMTIIHQSQRKDRSDLISMFHAHQLIDFQLRDFRERLQRIEVQLPEENFEHDTMWKLETMFSREQKMKHQLHQMQKRFHSMNRKMSWMTGFFVVLFVVHIFVLSFVIRSVV